MGALDFVFHLDKYLSVLIQNYGILIYFIIFMIIFMETGVVVTPFLPGDSILFATGAIFSAQSLNLIPIMILVCIAAILGDGCNYYIGKKIGTKILNKEKNRFIKKEHINKASNFYNNHGSMTIVLGRFIPIIRTFVPFVAGIGNMKYTKFSTYNILGGIIWVNLFLGGGYLFGSMPFIKKNFSYVLGFIILISIVPAVIAFIKEKNNKTA